MKTSATGGVKSDNEILAAPFDLLLQRVEETIKLRILLSELLFIVLYFSFFIAFVFIQSQTEAVYEVNTALDALFRDKAIPGEGGEPVTFKEISNTLEWRSWFDNVAYPVLIDSKYASTTGISAAPSFAPTSISTGSPNVESSLSEFREKSNIQAVEDILFGPFNATQSFFGVLWQKRVRPGKGSDCPQAPNFIWNNVALLNAPSNQPATPSNSPVSIQCFPSYSTAAEQTSPEVYNSMFQYQASSPINDPGMMGVLQIFYPSNGYYSSRINATNFAHWPKVEPSFIDEATRLVAVTAVTFNPTYRTWSIVSLYSEIFENGDIRPAADVVTGPLMYCSSSSDPGCTDSPVELVMASILGVFVIIHFLLLIVVRRSLAVYKIVFQSGRRTLSQILVAWFWDIVEVRAILDIAQTALGLITLSYISKTYWSRERYTSLTKISLQNMAQTDASNVASHLNEFVYMQQIFGSQIILFNIQVFKYFPALPCCVLVRQGWYNVYKDVVKVFITYWILIFAYSLVGMLVFGQYYAGFAAYATSLSTTVRMILGEASFDTLRRISPDFAWVFLIFFIVTFVYILQALFLAVVIEGFRLAFYSYETRKATDWRELIRKTFRNDTGRSYEFAARLRAWKAMKVNKNMDYITKAQLKSALRGQTYNRMDITDETVDEVFLMIRASELKRMDPVIDNPHDRNHDGNNSMLANENSALMPQLIKTMFEIKANESNLMKEMGSIMNQLRQSKEDTETILRATDRASAAFLKEE